MGDTSYLSEVEIKFLVILKSDKEEEEEFIRLYTQTIIQLCEV